MTIRLLIADDDEFVRAGLRSFLHDSGIKLVGEAADCREVLDQVQRTAPDVVLLNPQLSSGQALELVRQIRQLNSRLAVIIWSTHASPPLLAAAHDANAVGLLLRGSHRDTIVAAIERAAAGRVLWTREQLRRAASAAEEVDLRLEVQLTRREREVLAKVVGGLTNKQIAQELNISYETVKEHVQHLLDKIGVVDRTQAAVWAVRKGLL